MTRLARHDEIVERMARAILDATLWPGAWLKANEVETNAAKHTTTAALDALLTAVVELGVGEVFPFEAPHTPCILIHLEDKP